MRLEIRPLIILDFATWLLELKNDSPLEEEGDINNVVDVVIVMDRYLRYHFIMCPHNVGFDSLNKRIL